MDRRVSLFALVALYGLASLPAGAAEKTPFARADRAAVDLAQRLSAPHLQARLRARGLDLADVRASRVQVDDQAMAHSRYQQQVDGVPVFGGEAIVHLKADGSLFAVTDDTLAALRVDTRPTLDAAAAVETAVKSSPAGEALTGQPQADLWVLRHDGGDYLVWRVRLQREDGSQETALPVLFVDAHNGSVVWQYDNLQTATGSGSSLYSGTVSITTYLGGSTYYMEDTTRKIGTFDNRNTTGSTYRFTDTDNTWNSTTQRAGVDAHYGSAKVYDYFKSVHGRNGIDGSGGPGYYTSADGVTRLISSKVHYGSRYNNAFWNGSYMTYGDGDGTTFTPLVTLDIAGHEMTHGVTERTAGLVYSNQSGALNEAVSDIFGAMVERYVKGESSNTWKIGEQAYTPATSGDALRYMDNPHAAPNSGYTADDDPDHYSERYTGTADNGGVHINSGIANKAFYLLAKGGTHHRGGSMTGIGSDVAARIWYRALTSYMTSSTNFAGARTACLNAASALYGSTSTQYAAVRQSWCLVGVGACQ